MDEMERILRSLQDTITVLDAMGQRNAARLQEHQEWLETMNLAWARSEEAWQRHEAAWKRHEAAWQEHQEWLVAHDRAMVEIDRKMDSLIANIDRFILGRNVN